VKPAFVPDAGDLVWLTFDSQACREQAGRRPALVPSPKPYNAKIWLGARHAEKLGVCTDEVIADVRAKLAALLGY
jgi:hypothetical protein